MKILQADKSTEKVGLREKVAYGFGDAAFSMFWKLFTMYLLFFYTDVVGIGAAVVGTMIFVTRFWDAFLDVGIGIMADRTKSRWGMFRPYLLWGAIPFGLVGVLTFTAPELSATGKIVYAYISYSLMMIVYSLLNVPYASLLGVMTPDSKVRTQLSSYRMIFAFIGSIVVLLLVEPLVEFFSKWNVSGAEVNLKFGWQMSAIVFSILAVVLLLLCFAWTKERVKPIKQAKNPIKTDLKELLINKPWWILLGASISTLMFNSIRDGVAVYFFKYNVVETHLFHISFMNTNLALITVYLVLGQAANIVGILLTSPVSNKIGKRATFF
ncbi:MAG: MFS transporter, partial [Bacteroides sp.]